MRAHRRRICFSAACDLQRMERLVTIRPIAIVPAGTPGGGKNSSKSMLSLAIYWEDWSDITGGSLARAYHLLQRIDLGPERDSGRGPLFEFNVGSHPGDSTHDVNATDMLSLSLLQARLIDLKLPIKIVEGE